MCPTIQLTLYKRQMFRFLKLWINIHILKDELSVTTVKIKKLF